MIAFTGAVDFDGYKKKLWKYPSWGKDSINFTVDKDIILHGLCLLGKKNNDYSVTLTIKQTDTESVLASKTGTFSSKLLQHANGNYYGFELLFDSTVACKKNTAYEIEALITGPTRSWRGSDGLGTVVCSGVKFLFTDNDSSNGTSVRNGQFPEILFSVLT